MKRYLITFVTFLLLVQLFSVEPPQNLIVTPSLTEIELNWEQGVHPNILLYKIFRDTSPNPIIQIDATVHPITSYSDANILPNTTYYYRVTCYTSTGDESDFSNEVFTQLLPEIVVNPTSFDLIINSQTGNTIIDNFDIDNIGNGQLEYQIVGSDNLDFFDFGNCLSFDGNSDYVTLQSISEYALPNDFTFSGWFYLNSLPSQYYVVFSSPVNGAISFIIGSDFLGLGTAQQAPEVGYICNYTIPSNDWFHWSVTRSGNTVFMYINGTSIGSSTLNTSYIAGSRTIGIDGNQSSYPYNGKMDNIRLWNVFKSEIDIQDLMYSELSGSENDLVGCWNFNDSNENIAYDNSQYNNDGSINNAVKILSDLTGLSNSILSFTPTSGILNGGSRLTQNVIMTVDMEGLTDGIYNTSSEITHNDPNETNPYIIPVTINVDRNPPDQVTGLSATPTMSDITLSWDASIASDLDKYYIYRSVENDNPIYLAEVDEPTTNYVDSSIPNEEYSYYYWVSAVDINENEGVKSDSILTYLDIPAKVQNVSISFLNGDAILTWDEVTETVYENPIQNLTGYIVYFAEDIYEADTLFAYHGFTTETIYTHQYAGIFADRMFYKVTAYVGDLRILNAIVKEHPEIQPGMLNELIDQKIKMLKKKIGKFD